MSPALLPAIEQKFKSASVTFEWFHVFHLFIKALDDVRKLKARQSKLPDHTHWAVLKGPETIHTQNQNSALLEVDQQGFATAKACCVKEHPRSARQAAS